MTEPTPVFGGTNYIVDVYDRPTWVKFTNGRTVRINGEGFLDIGWQDLSQLLHREEPTVKDEDIDTSDIPEITDFSKAVRGKYHRQAMAEKIADEMVKRFGVPRDSVRFLVFTALNG